ncbi:MAG: ATP-binding protein, partial [Magnetospirillum sp.]|nr:ATP-binding protein [Magnetospirillum sp.]
TAVPDAGLALDERQTGGWGVQFVRTFSRRYEYRRDGNRNVVTLWLDTEDKED